VTTSLSTFHHYRFYFCLTSLLGFLDKLQSFFGFRTPKLQPSPKPAESSAPRRARGVTANVPAPTNFPKDLDPPLAEPTSPPVLVSAIDTKQSDETAKKNWVLLIDELDSGMLPGMIDIFSFVF